MNITELVREVSHKSEITQRDCEIIIRNTFDVIAEELAGHGSIRIPKFGLFDTKLQAARTYISPATQEEVNKPAHMTPRFKYAQAIKDKVAEE